MAPTEADRVHTLEDFSEVFTALTQAGFDFVVIGGLAVGAYGHLLGETHLSADIDLYVDQDNLDAIVRWVQADGGVVRKMPHMSNIDVAFVQWQGKEFNLLTSSVGLPAYDAVQRTARVFHSQGRSDMDVCVADPYDLLSNKLHINRPKDQPHIEMLMRFVEEEIAAAFNAQGGSTRARLEPAKRLLRAMGTHRLPQPIAARLVPLARSPLDFRSLLPLLPTADLADALVGRAPAEVLEQIEEARRQLEF